MKDFVAMLRFASVGLLSLNLVACFAPTMHASSSQSFRDTRLGPAISNAASVALLPTTSPTGIAVETAGGLEGLKRVVNAACELAFNTQFPGVAGINANESLRRVNSAGIAQDYANMLEGYERTSIVNADVLKRMGAAVDSHFLLHTRVTGFRTWKDGDNTRAELSLFAQIWDTSEGSVVWEATSAASGTKTMLDKSLTLDAMANEACSALMVRLRRES